MSFVKFNDLVFNQEVLTKVVETFDAPNSLKNKKKLDKFLVIDFSGADSSKLVLDGLRKGDIRYIVSEIISGNIKLSFDMFSKFFKYAEYQNEEILWNFLVDDGHLISDEIYQVNSYDENLAIAYKYLNSK